VRKSFELLSNQLILQQLFVQVLGFALVPQNLSHDEVAITHLVSADVAFHDVVTFMEQRL
jgi:hypothetical protein